MDTELGTKSSSSDSGTKLFKYRWIVLFIFCLFSVVNFMQVLQFTIIANTIRKFYGLESFAVDVTGLIFFAVYIILFLPISFLIERYSLRATALVSTGLTVAGNLVKLLCAHPDRFYVAVLGQTLCAIAQVYILSIPSKFASLWFGPNEVSTACALAVFGMHLGSAIGAVLPSTLMESDADDIGGSLYNMMIYNAVASSVVFVIVIVFFKARPELPPSQSQLQLLDNSEVRPEFFENCKTLLKNKNFLLLLFSFGLFCGLWNSFGITVNTVYTNYFPNGESDLGIITLTAICGGCVGSIVVGFILDKTHQFKRISFAIMFIASLTYILVDYTLLSKSRIGTYISIPIFGIFMASAQVTSFEFTLEVTYPIPESVSCSVLNATVYIFAILCTLGYEGLLISVGFLNTFIATLMILLLCTCILVFISANLHRRNANIANTNLSQVVENSS